MILKSLSSDQFNSMILISVVTVLTCALAAALVGAEARTLSQDSSSKLTEGGGQLLKHQIHKRQVIYHRDSYEDSSQDEDISSFDQHYREKLKESSKGLGSERSYNEIMRELRKDQILREHEQDEDQKDGSNTLQADPDYGDLIVNAGKPRKQKGSSNFWTYLLGGAIVVIITLIAIIISLAVHNRRAMQAQAYQVPNLEAPKIVVEENIYTTAPPKPAQNSQPPPAPPSPVPAPAPTREDPTPAIEETEDPPATETLLAPAHPQSALVNPNPIRQPFAPFTYSPIPVRPPADV